MMMMMMLHPGTNHMKATRLGVEPTTPQ